MALPGNDWLPDPADPRRNNGPRGLCVFCGPSRYLRSLFSPWRKQHAAGPIATTKPAMTVRPRPLANFVVNLLRALIRTVRRVSNSVGGY